MTVQLSTIISHYFDASDARDVDAIAACFTDDAALTDDGRTYRGRDEIRQWRQEISAASESTLEVLSDAPAGTADLLTRHDVTTRLKGNFPGGTIDLVHRFGLRDELIARLSIAPEGSVP
jgi:ketosteroid isomerase-like protein